MFKMSVKRGQDLLMASQNELKKTARQYQIERTKQTGSHNDSRIWSKE